MKQHKAAATSLAVSTEPPGDSGDAPKTRPWISDDDEVQAPPSEGSHPARKVRMVGAVVDPAVDDDGLSLSGPGAPGRTFSAEPVEHPVRARLLEKAQRASDPGAPPQAPTVEAPEPTPAPLPAYAGPEPRFSESAAPPQVKTTPTTETTSPIAAPRAEAPSSAAPAVKPIAPSPVTPTAEAPSVSSDSSAPPVEALIPSSQLTPPPGAVASELERIARRPAQSAPGPSLSPNMVAVLGGLVGLTVISTLGVFLSRTKSEAVDVPAATKPVEEQPKAPEPPKVEPPKRQKVPGPWRIQDDANKPGNKVLKGKIGKNAFLRAIQDAGLPKSEAYRVYGALKDQLDLDHCKKTDSFLALVSGREKTLVAFEYIVTKEDVYQVKENKQGRLAGNKLDLKVARNQIRRSFTHDGKSFEQSARRAGFDPGISSMAEVSLRGHSSMSDFKAGDRIRVIAQEVTVLGEFSRYSGVEAMEINRAGEEPRRIYYYPHPIEGGHFDKNGRAPYEGGWRKPIPNAVRTSPFNPKRMHPILKKIRPHNGTDFGCSTGTPIGATSPGTIVVRGLGGGYGNLVRIKHDGGYESGYAHLSRFESGQKIGDRVERMQTIGYCGSTGRSTGPHLHFEMKKDGVYIDAETLSLDGLRVLPKAHRNEFAEVRAKYDPILDKIPLPEPMAAPAPAPAPAATAPEAAPSNPMVAEPAPGQASSPAPTPAAAPAPAPAAQPAPAAPSAPAQPAQPQAPSAIFLTDTELLKMQSATDDGEVAE